MNHISNYTNKTTVKTLGKVLVLFVGLIPQTSYSVVQSSAECIATYEKGSNELKQCLADASKQSAADDARKTCKEATRIVSDATNKIGEACRKGGLGQVKSCMDKSIKCGEVSSSDTFSSTAQILSQMSTDTNVQVLGNAIGQSGANQSCPQMSGRDYWSEKDKITKDLETTKEDLAKLNDDKAKIEDDFNKEIQSLQDELNKAQEDLDKTKLDIKDKKRKMLSDFQNQQNQMKDELRKKTTESLNLRGQLIQSQQDQALKLIAMTDASGKRACMKAVNDAKKAYDALATSGSSNYIAQAKTRKEDLINTYNDCMDAFMQQRNALNKSKKQEQDQINKALTDTQQSIEELNNSLNSAQTQLTEMQNDAQTEEDNATQKVTKLMQTNQNKMLAAQQKMQSNLQTLAAKNQNLTQKLNRLNNSLMTLGAAPKSRSSDYAPSDAASDISTQVDLALQTMNDPDVANCFKGSEYSGLKSKLKDYRNNSNSDSGVD